MTHHNPQGQSSASGYGGGSVDNGGSDEEMDGTGVGTPTMGAANEAENESLFQRVSDQSTEK